MVNDPPCTAHLRFCSAEGNHNKEYIICPDPDDSSLIMIKYGRYGASMKTIRRPKYLFHQTVEEKKKEGYVDVTDFTTVSTPSQDAEYAPIADDRVRSMVDCWLACSKRTVSQNYTISFNEVTEAMVDKAQSLIDEGKLISSVDNFNDLLIQLFTVLPRKMKKVSDNLAHGPDDFDDILIREQQLLDAMSASVTSAQKPVTETEKKETILDAIGVKIAVAGETATKKAVSFLDDDVAKHVLCVYRVRNKARDDAFDRYCKDHNIKKKDMHFVYHGTPNERMFGLVKLGNKKGRKVDSGNMFSAAGEGMYFAFEAQKSLNYTNMPDAYWRTGRHYKYSNAVDGRYYLLVCKVAYANPLDVYAYTHACSHFTKDNIAPHDAVYAHAANGFLYHDELVMYNEPQVTLQYVIEFK